MISEITLNQQDNVRLSAIAGLAIWLSGFLVSVHAATLTVDNLADPGDGDCSTNGCTLREAVAEASAGDEIVFDGALGTSTVDTIVLSGSEILIDQPLTITGNPLLEIDANGASRIFSVSISGSIADVLIRDLTLRNGSALEGGALFNRENLTLERVDFLGNRAVRSGGAIDHRTGLLLTRDCRFESNEVEDPDQTSGNGGGAIHSFGSLTVEGSTFVDNHARSSKSGGAIHFINTASGELRIERFIGSTVVAPIFRNNSSERRGGAIDVTHAQSFSVRFALFEENMAGGPENVGEGGAIFIDSDVVGASITTSRFLNNAADRGGAINNQSTLSGIRTIFQGNEAFINGGGIYNEQGGSVDLGQGLFSLNLAKDGGAIYNDSDSSLELENITLSGNLADPDGFSRGGAIYHRGDSVALRNVTADDNVAGIEGHAFHIPGGSGDLTLVNSIVASSEPSNNCGGALPISGGYNIDNGDSCGLSEMGDLSNTNPLLGPLQYNGGGGGNTHHPLIGSPAIDGGLNSDCPAIDQRLDERPVDGDGDGTAVCDIGAVESHRLVFKDRFESS